MANPVIATWFVSDTEREGTFFPQLGLKSSNPAAKRAYWHCIIAFYATSLGKNPDFPHAFFTNTPLPVVDGVDVEQLFLAWQVEIVHLPIQHRLPPTRVTSWGNQFYIVDILRYLSLTARWQGAIILDSDVVWTQSAHSIAAEIQTAGVLTYVHDLDAYPAGALINGVTRAQLAAFTNRFDTETHSTIVYCGGEIVAANLEHIRRIDDRIKQLWPQIMSGESFGPQEEAHLLSIVYALERYRLGSADRFIKRMWTTFKYNNLSPQDQFLTLWHLPAEKRTGFREFFSWLRANGVTTKPPAGLAITTALLGEMFGVPRRTPAKTVSDLFTKSRHKMLAQLQKVG